jgi:hypothetical protein
MGGRQARGVPCRHNERGHLTRDVFPDCHLRLLHTITFHGNTVTQVICISIVNMFFRHDGECCRVSDTGRLYLSELKHLWSEKGAHLLAYSPYNICG